METQRYAREAKRGKPKATDPLWYLGERDNIDKHRTILVMNPTASADFLIEANV